MVQFFEDLPPLELDLHFLIDENQGYTQNNPNQNTSLLHRAYISQHILRRCFAVLSDEDLTQHQQLLELHRLTFLYANWCRYHDVADTESDRVRAALSDPDDEHRWVNDEVLPELQGQSLTAQETSRASGPVTDSPECISSEASR